MRTTLFPISGNGVFYGRINGSIYVISEYKFSDEEIEKRSSNSFCPFGKRAQPND
jgi:hypothetical protein